MKLLVAAALAAGALALDNGKARTPPMGWRSWNLFHADVSQDLMETQMRAIVSRARTVNGVPTSLADLGYRDVGLDDAWQLVGSYGPLNFTYHLATGQPVVNTTRFPDFISMTALAHSLNLTAGWYLNNCIGSDHCGEDYCYQGDVEALLLFGFDSVKLDNCGAQHDLDMWTGLITQSGASILTENCHWGQTLPNATWCPFNYYRTSGDIGNYYASIASNLQTVVPLANTNLSYPGCWAYPDMLEVGVYPNGLGSGLSFVEARSHFGAWSIVSSPLILSHDMTNDTVTDFIWPIITNTEAIAVNQAWAGNSGTVFAQSSSLVALDAGVSVPSWQQWYKPLGGGKTAVLVMNHASTSQAITVTFTQVPNTPCAANVPCSVRDIWNHANMGAFKNSLSVTLASHDSAFLVLSAA